MTTTSHWEPLDLSGLIERLGDARALLEQAATLAAAHDSGRITTLAELHRRLAQDDHAHAHRRRYR